MEITAILEWFYLQEVVSEERFTVYGEYADRHKTEPIFVNLRPKPNKFQILNHLSIHDGMYKNPSHATVPLRYIEGVSDVYICLLIF
jgi:hypothetical protein